MKTQPDVLTLLAQVLAMPWDNVRAGVEDAKRGRYQTWHIRKGPGRYRQIAAPSEPLKRLQRRVLDRLLNPVQPSPFAHGFVPGRSIVTNARVHAATARGMLSADLKDAFPSVKADRVREVIEWRAGPSLRYLTPLSEPDLLQRTYDALAMVCTIKGSLPQGAPTSGMLLNWACARLDRLVATGLLRGRLAKRYPDLRYSRYADDLTLTSSREIGADLERELWNIVRVSGFTLNPAKVTRTHARHADLVICGIRLRPDGALSLSRRKLREVRALFHEVACQSPAMVHEDRRQKVAGTLGLVRMIASECPAPLRNPLERLLTVHAEWLHPQPRPQLPTYREVTGATEYPPQDAPAQGKRRHRRSSQGTDGCGKPTCATILLAGIIGWAVVRVIRALLGD